MRKGQKMTIKQRENVSLGHIGIKGYWFGKKRSKLDCEKISKANKGRIMPPRSEEHRKRISNALMGRKLSKEHIIKLKLYKASKETKRKISLAMTKENHPLWGKKHSEEAKKKMSIAKKGKNHFYAMGEKSHLWKGGITPINIKIRTSLEYKLWRDAVFARDGYTCQKTGIKGMDLEAHHILNFANNPELRFAIDNGITFSKEVHKEFHNIYGQKNNTKEQLEEFISSGIILLTNKN